MEKHLHCKLKGTLFLYFVQITFGMSANSSNLITGFGGVGFTRKAEGTKEDWPIVE